MVHQPNFWNATVAERAPRAPLRGPQSVDVAIVGAGFTGLWTAYYLKQAAPALDVAVVEAETAGFGASGRNGGWVIGGLAGLARLVGDRPAAERRQICGVVADNVDAIGDVLAREGIAADFHKGGALFAAARYREQIALQDAHLSHLRELGYTGEHCHWLDAAALARHAHFRRGYGGVYFAPCATVNPRRLIDGLAVAVERLGVRLYEGSRVDAIRRGRLTTAEGHVEASTIVTAVEGYAADLLALQQHVLPVHSLVIATAPLPAERWQEIGMAERPAFADASRLINYGHRSADDRLVFGARGRYDYGARPRYTQSITASEIRMRRDLLADLIPALGRVEIDYAWGGSLGLSRSFRPHAIVDRREGLATAGGYAGEGVAGSHLMARTLADLILGHDTPLARMPWAQANADYRDVLRRWEDEPLRWLAAKAIGLSYAGEEKLMGRAGAPESLKRALARLNDRFASIIE